jgi:hypothetical protein
MQKTDFTYDVEKHTQFFYLQLSERDKRLFAGLEAIKAGYNGVAEVSQKFDMHKHTVRRGKAELLREIIPPAKKVRQTGGGRKKNGINK